MFSRTRSSAKEALSPISYDPNDFIHFYVEYINSRYEISLKKQETMVQAMEMIRDCYKDGTASFPEEIEKGKISLILRSNSDQKGTYL